MRARRPRRGRAYSPGLAIAILLATGCNPRIGEFEERGDRYSAQGSYADALVEYELALEEAGTRAPAGLRMKAGALALRSKSFSDATRHFDALIASEGSYRDRVAALLKQYAKGTHHAIRHHPDDPNVIRFEVSRLNVFAVAGGMMLMGLVFLGFGLLFLKKAGGQPSSRAARSRQP